MGMVEKVSKAIEDELANDWYGVQGDIARRAARAAIQAMREPTEAMKQASRDMSPGMSDVVGAEYRAMIDAALADSDSKTAG
jgi:hypothetical protein